jgi:hypothetical protein
MPLVERYPGCPFGPPSTRRSSVIARVAQAGPCSRWIIGRWANPPAPGDRLSLLCRTARIDGQPPQSSVDQHGVGEPVDEGRPEPCPQPPWSPSDVERRAVAAGDVVPALQPHSPMRLSGDPTAGEPGARPGAPVCSLRCPLPPPVQPPDSTHSHQREAFGSSFGSGALACRRSLHS